MSAGAEERDGVGGADRILALVSEAAQRLDRRQPRIARDMTDLIMRHIRSLDVDPQFLELLRASVDANTKTLTHILINHIPIEHLQPTTAAVEYAMRLAQREVPANSLVRAYSVGKDDFIEQMFPDVQALDCSAEEKFEVLHHMATVVGRYIDWISQYVFEAYEAERERWLSTQGTVRAALIHDVLGGQNVAPVHFEKETGYRLSAHHLGMIIWSVAAAPAPDELRLLTSVVSKVAAGAGCSGAPLVTAVDRETAWAWLPFAVRPAEVDTTQIGTLVGQTPTCRAALGLSASGVTGFRRTHVQAQAARRVAVASGGTAPIMGFGDEGVAITSMLAGDLDSARAWVGEVLGQLALDNDTSQVLRETLRVFYLTGESYTDTAEIMRLHRNTVKYRVSRALELRDPATRSHRVDLAVALNACHFLGSAVLAAPGPR
ncbi:helix-turn-helix domain-containing protein [Blastococcus sp. BMG 814]|uniref:Helix-turn-helix domain-containing protein n=1 Tax=Blastococcus carthaginiensis TaxID=3050034 RepID=A0ABT9IF62_9ACTN|nr:MULTISPECIES: helix-turn-helix domain-containing protein [Blastococcus]MDP5184220.1 helix-turn-helix domain-containing protein [Blastococcus carthaginiensis]